MNTVIEIDMSIGNRIRQLRKAKGFTQRQLSIAAGLDVMVISRLERGEVDDPQWSTVLRIAQALGVGLDEISEELPPPKPKRKKKDNQ